MGEDDQDYFAWLGGLEAEAITFDELMGLYVAAEGAPETTS